jgi:hypothetical protein
MSPCIWNCAEWDSNSRAHFSMMLPIVCPSSSRAAPAFAAAVAAALLEATTRPPVDADGPEDAAGKREPPEEPGAAEDAPRNREGPEEPEAALDTAGSTFADGTDAVDANDSLLVPAPSKSDAVDVPGSLRGEGSNKFAFLPPAVPKSVSPEGAPEVAAALPKSGVAMDPVFPESMAPVDTPETLAPLLCSVALGEALATAAALPKMEAPVDAALPNIAAPVDAVLPNIAAPVDAALPKPVDAALPKSDALPTNEAVGVFPKRELPVDAALPKSRAPPAAFDPEVAPELPK